MKYFKYLNIGYDFTKKQILKVGSVSDHTQRISQLLNIPERRILSPGAKTCCSSLMSEIKTLDTARHLHMRGEFCFSLSYNFLLHCVVFPLKVKHFLL